MAESNVELRVEIEGIKRDLENVSSINGRLDTAIEKLTDEIIFEKIKDRADEIDSTVPQKAEAIMSTNNLDCDTFLIHLSKVKTSLDSALETKTALEKINIFPKLFEGTYGNDAERLFQEEQRILRNVESFPEIKSSLAKSSKAMKKKIKRKYMEVCGPGAKGVFHSHYRLWNYCVTINKPIMIFEDDVVIVREYKPLEFNEILILSINSDWKDTVECRSPWAHFLYETNQLMEAQNYTETFIPTTSGYIIKPTAAKKLIDYYNKTNTFIVSDLAISSDIVNMQIHPQLIGRAKTSKEKQSLVWSNVWETL